MMDVDGEWEDDDDDDTPRKRGKANSGAAIARKTRAPLKSAAGRYARRSASFEGYTDAKCQPASAQHARKSRRERPRYQSQNAETSLLWETEVRQNQPAITAVWKICSLMYLATMLPILPCTLVCFHGTCTCTAHLYLSQGTTLFALAYIL